MSLQSLLAPDSAAPVTCRPTDTVLSAIDLMIEKNRNAILVTSEDGALLGILTEHDVMRAVKEGRGNIGRAIASSVMTDKVITCRAATSLSEALSMMGRHAIRHLVVTDGQRLAGLVSIKDILAALHQQDLLEMGVLRDMTRTLRIMAV